MRGDRLALCVRAAALWLVVIAAEFVHGALRAAFVVPLAGDLRARQIGVFTGTALVYAVAWCGARRFGAAGRRELLACGAIWAALTLCFEISFGLLLGYPPARIAADYDPRRGGLLAFGLAAMTLAPLAAARLRGLVKD